jgi:ADP-ribosyl-[dinitrogen reductase] hydrolase
MSKLSFQKQILGGLYGALVGDALGVPVEFCTRASCQAYPVTGMRSYGTHAQPAGTWSDDGSLLLCSVDSIVATGGAPQDMGNRFLKWMKQGLWAARGEVFDIGNTTSIAINRIAYGTPAEQAGGCSEHDNGNGSLMRILPVCMAVRNEPDPVLAAKIQTASRITHGHLRSQLACVFYALFTSELLLHNTPQAALTNARLRMANLGPLPSAFDAIQHQDIASMTEPDIVSGGYVLDTLMASVWCLLTTTSYADCVLRAVNLGGDTDTTGCVAGGLAGMYYGIKGIPQEWVQTLPEQAVLDCLFTNFLVKISISADE